MSEQGKSPVNSRNIFIVIIVMLIGAVVYFAYFNKNGINLTDNKKETTENQSKNDKYQAVFLTNGQVYFGKLKDEGGNYVKLTDIYYLQAKDQAVQPKESANEKDPNLTLIKLGKELHAPADEMNISRQQVLFWEDINDDGKVKQAIEEYKKSNK